MSEKELRLRDFIRVEPDRSIKSMDEAQMVVFRDSLIGASRKGLLVTFDLSHSGRKINNRIYPPWGQRDGAESWTEPFRRPIIINHDSSRDPIGRFVKVWWESLEVQAIDHLGDISAYLKVKQALDSNDPQRIYRTYSKYGLFKDKNWPGVGKLVAQALITDKDAIEKFLDGRYLTFSAGSRTNAYTCMLCGAGWHTGDICDHRPGHADEDGLTAYFMTGLFLGDEGSVVNMPGDTFSQVRNLEVQDFQGSFASDAETQPWIFMDADTNNFVLTDSKLEVTSMPIELKDLMELEPETIVSKLADGTLEFNFEDLRGDTQLELQWLVRIHDSMHHRYDGTIRGEFGESMDTIPTDVFKLHGMLHELSMEKDFRDTLINGDLDKFDMQGAPSEMYVVKRASAQDSELSNQFNQLKDEIMDVVKTALGQKEEGETSDNVTEVQDDATGTPPAEAAEIQDSGASVQSAAEEEEKEEEAKEEEVASDSDDAPALEDQIKALLEGDKDAEAVVAEIKNLVAEDVEEGGEFIDDDTIDWFVMETALNALVTEDARLTAAQRKKLSAKTFCGPDRSFPVPDCAHVTAARRLIGRAKLSSSQKARVLACVNRKAKNMGCDSNNDSDCNCSDCRCKEYDALNNDYAAALKQIDSVKDQLAKVLEAHATALETEVSDAEDTIRLDSLLTWFGTIEPKEKSTTDSKNPVEHIKAVDNPSEASSEGKETSRKLGDYEQRIVTKYKTIRDKEGQDEADRWLHSARRYLPATLDLTKYIN